MFQRTVPGVWFSATERKEITALGSYFYLWRWQKCTVLAEDAHSPKITAAALHEKPLAKLPFEASKINSKSRFVRVLKCGRKRRSERHPCQSQHIAVHV